MDTYKVKWTQLQRDIFRVLSLNYGKELSAREIARLTKKTPTAVLNSLKKLEKEKIVSVKKHDKLNLLSISLNKENERIVELKRVDNLQEIYESGLSNHLKEKFPGTTIILFGSYSRGEDTIYSDIDIAIVNSKEKNLEIEKFEKVLERKIIIQFYDSFEKIHKNLKESILNGILLYGSIEL
jgi:predicted nucleotidyltransferase